MEAQAIYANVHSPWTILAETWSIHVFWGLYKLSGVLKHQKDTEKKIDDNRLIKQ